MASVNQTRPHCVNQMGKTNSKPLAARHAMCESALRPLQTWRLYHTRRAVCEQEHVTISCLSRTVITLPVACGSSVLSEVVAVSCPGVVFICALLCPVLRSWHTKSNRKIELLVTARKSYLAWEEPFSAHSARGSTSSAFEQCCLFCCARNM